MKTLTRTLCAVLLTCGFAGSAVAATDTAPTGSTNSQRATPHSQAPAHVSLKLRDDLTKAGFTNITIMPSSFLVRAKDLQGNPMMMVINPDFVTEVTAQSAPAVSGAMKGAANTQTPSPTEEAAMANSDDSYPMSGNGVPDTCRRNHFFGASEATRLSHSFLKASKSYGRKLVRA